jgi:hypothetical protein
VGLQGTCEMGLVDIWWWWKCDIDSIVLFVKVTRQHSGHR